MDEAARSWEAVRTYVARNCGVHLAVDQQYLMNARLEPVAQAGGFASVEAFVQAACAVDASTPLGQVMLDAMTTHESFFFRDASFWQTFEDDVFPKVQATQHGSITIWCAACAHGQEPYSIAMLVQERWPELADRIRLHATDVSSLAIQRARTGVFTGLEVNRGLSAQRIARHFEPVRGGFRIKEALRNRVRWETQNLLRDRSSAESIDIALCRNVLIYMNETERRQAVNTVASAVFAHGYIGVGATETIWNTPGQRGWYRKDQAPPRTP